MSKLKTTFDSTVLKDRVSSLMEKIDRNNTSKLIAERILSKIASIEVAEGSTTPSDAYHMLKGVGVDQAKAKHAATASIINESKAKFANPFLIEKINVVRSAAKELSTYSWMPVVKEFIDECNSMLNENETAIIIESVIYDLEVSRDAKFYEKAISKLRECSEAENPVFAIAENMQSEKWIPLVKQLLEYCEATKGKIGGNNANFRVSKVYSPVVVNENETYTFFSKGKFFTFDGESVVESESTPSPKTIELIKLMESVNITKNGIRFYPKAGSILDVIFEGENAKIVVDGKEVESKDLESHLLKTGMYKFNEIGKVQTINRAIAEGREIKEIDFAYCVESNRFKGLSATVFTINESIFIQKVNIGMKENSLVKAESAQDAVKIVKEFMNYDISNSVNGILEAEEAKNAKIKEENSKIERKIQFLQEKLSELDRIEKLAIYDNEHIIKAKSLVEAEIQSHTEELAKKNS
jgi:hypothetical protein